MELKANRLKGVWIKAHFNIDKLAVFCLAVNVKADLPIPHVVYNETMRSEQVSRISLLPAMLSMLPVSC